MVMNTMFRCCLICGLFYHSQFPMHLLHEQFVKNLIDDRKLGISFIIFTKGLKESCVISVVYDYDERKHITNNRL